MYQVRKDVYVEARFKRKSGGREIVIVIGLVLMILILFALSVLLGDMMGNYAFISWAILAFAVVYAWKFGKKLNVEYEYTFTNGDLDIDKVIAKEDRKHRYSVKCEDMEFFEPYDNPAKYAGMKFDRIAYPCTSKNDKGLYCFAFKEKTYGRCLVVINMTDELREAVENARPKMWGNH